MHSLLGSKQGVDATACCAKWLGIIRNAPAGIEFSRGFTKAASAARSRPAQRLQRDLISLLPIQLAIQRFAGGRELASTPCSIGCDPRDVNQPPAMKIVFQLDNEVLSAPKTPDGMSASLSFRVHLIVFIQFDRKPPRALQSELLLLYSQRGLFRIIARLLLA